MLFCSDLFGYFKPDPQTYLGACRLLALEPGAVMMVACHRSDLQARITSYNVCYTKLLRDAVGPGIQRVPASVEPRARRRVGQGEAVFRHQAFERLGMDLVDPPPGTATGPYLGHAVEVGLTPGQRQRGDTRVLGRPAQGAGQGACHRNNFV